MRSRSILLIVGLGLFLTSCKSDKKKQPAKSDLAHGQEVLKQLQAGECAGLWPTFSDKMKGALGTEKKFSAMCKSLATTLEGAKVLGEEVEQVSSSKVYVARMETKAGVLRLMVSREATGTIDGLLIRPDGSAKPAPSKYNGYQTKTPLRLPFTTEWTVFWGGRTIEQNYHVAYANQHFAYDLVVTKSGATHKGDGKANSDYYCFGQEVVAAGAGKVIEAIVGVKDNVPGQMNAQQITGNHVIIDHGNSEYTLYAHLKLDSTKVKVGQSVEQGTLLGLCGNSGNSSEPHLHFHLQDKPKFGAGESMPSQFLRYRAGGKLIERGEPIKGQIIRPESP